MIAMQVSSVGFNEWDVMKSRVMGGSFMIVERSRQVIRGDP